MIADGARFQARPGVVLTGNDAARFATDLASGEVFELNETAAIVYEAAAAGRSVGDVVNALAERYPEVPREEIERDARDLLTELERHGLVERVDRPA